VFYFGLCLHVVETLRCVQIVNTTEEHKTKN